MAEKRYTLREAVVELTRRQCEEGWHAPSVRMATLGDPIGIHHCDCGKVTWKPHVRDEVTDETP